MGMLVGIDGSKRGWIAAYDNGTQIRLEEHATLDGLIADPWITVAVVDIPIGLPERGPRQADLMARKLLGGPRASSVFPAPVRAVLGADTRLEASRIWQSVDGRRCGAQTFAIVSRIRDVDLLMSPQLQQKIVEGHPEVSFAMMNGRRGLAHEKSRAAGKSERLNLLAAAFKPSDLSVMPLGPLSIDAADAVAMLWTARRIANGLAEWMPAMPQVDSRGLRQEIVG
jgi:predicted RNase H-like nuclease